jgi:hypothetical protein
MDQILADGDALESVMNRSHYRLFVPSGKRKDVCRPTAQVRRVRGGGLQPGVEMPSIVNMVQCQSI